MLPWKFMHLSWSLSVRVYPTSPVGAGHTVSRSINPMCPFLSLFGLGLLALTQVHGFSSSRRCLLPGLESPKETRRKKNQPGHELFEQATNDNALFPYDPILVLFGDVFFPALPAVTLFKSIYVPILCYLLSCLDHCLIVSYLLLYFCIQGTGWLFYFRYFLKSIIVPPFARSNGTSGPVVRGLSLAIHVHNTFTFPFLWKGWFRLAVRQLSSLRYFAYNSMNLEMSISQKSVGDRRSRLHPFLDFASTFGRRRQAKASSL